MDLRAFKNLLRLTILTKGCASFVCNSGQALLFPSNLATTKKKPNSSWQLFTSSSINSESVGSQIKRPQISLDDDSDLPWTEWQDWALRDNLPKYIVTIPPPALIGGKADIKHNDNTITPKQYALWRTLLREVPELNGYDLAHIRRMVAKQKLREIEEVGEDKQAGRINVPGVLPLLEQYEFESNEGISGVVFGFPGIADGTRLTTPPLKYMQQTVPQGYAYTEDGTLDSTALVAYELGTPKSELYSLDPAFRLSKTSQPSNGLSIPGVDQETSNMIVNIGGTTTMLLASAAAYNLMSHHLTVNMFWV